MKISHPQIRIFLRGKSGFFATAAGQSPGLPAALAAAHNPVICLLALPVIRIFTPYSRGTSECRQIQLSDLHLSGYNPSSLRY